MQGLLASFGRPQCILKCLLQLMVVMEFKHNVAAAHKLAIGIQLRVRGPVGVLLPTAAYRLTHAMAVALATSILKLWLPALHMCTLLNDC